MNRINSAARFNNIVDQYDQYVEKLTESVNQLSVEDLKEFKENYLTRAKRYTGLVQIVTYIISNRNQKVPSAPKAVQPKQAKAAMGVTSTLKRSGAVKAGGDNSQTDVYTDNTHTPMSFSAVRKPIESDDDAEKLVTQFKTISPIKMVSPTKQATVEVSEEDN